MEAEHYDPAEFVKWTTRLPDAALAKIAAETALLLHVGRALGLPLVRQIGGSLSELRVSAHGGLRLYFTILRSQDGIERVLFLTYGRKDTQERDIARARRRMP